MIEIIIKIIIMIMIIIIIIIIIIEIVTVILIIIIIIIAFIHVIYYLESKSVKRSNRNPPTNFRTLLVEACYFGRRTRGH
jgi:uncharacterized membrane protein